MIKLESLKKNSQFETVLKNRVINNELLLNKKLAYWGRAIARRNLNKLIDAILDYKKVLKIDPKNISALENLGDLFQQQGNYNEALEYSNKLIELVSNNAHYYSKRAYQKGLLNDNKGAIEDLNKAIEIEPKNSINFYNRGLAKNNLDNYKNAIEDYSMAIELDPEYASAYANRGYAKGSLGDFEGAIEDYNIAIDIKKNFIGAFLNRALIKYKIDDLEGAIRDSNKVLTLEENNKYALNTRGLAKYKLGDLKSGCIDLKRASNLDLGEAIKYLKSKEGKALAFLFKINGAEYRHPYTVFYNSNFENFFWLWVIYNWIFSLSYLGYTFFYLNFKLDKFSTVVEP